LLFKKLEKKKKKDSLLDRANYKTDLAVSKNEFEILDIKDINFALSIFLMWGLQHWHLTNDKSTFK
jgi:hypothetical protein